MAKKLINEDGNPRSGRSKSRLYPLGRRRILEGKEQAPKSARVRNGRKFLSECTVAEKKHAEILTRSELEALEAKDAV